MSWGTLKIKNFKMRINLKEREAFRERVKKLLHK